jgi:hypothetical protein
MNEKFESRKNSSLGLVLADLLLRYDGLDEEDKSLCKDGVHLAWKWLGGEKLDPYSLCEYVDGEINLPIRSMEYEKGSLAKEIITASFLAIGLVAFNACEEASVMATEGVENFGSNERERLLLRIERLRQEELELLKSIEQRLESMADSDSPDIFISREDLFG